MTTLPTLAASLSVTSYQTFHPYAREVSAAFLDRARLRVHPRFATELICWEKTFSAPADCKSRICAAHHGFVGRESCSVPESAGMSPRHLHAFGKAEAIDRHLSA